MDIPGPKCVDKIDLTPFEIHNSPAALWELEPILLSNLFEAICAYGFPHSYDPEVVGRTIACVVHDSPIKLTATTLGNVTSLSIGQARACHYVETASGLVCWQKDLTVRTVFSHLVDLDWIMEARGLYDIETNTRRETIAHGVKYRVAEVFAEKPAFYHLSPNWDADEILRWFDQPDLLACQTTQDGKRFVCRKEDARLLTTLNNRTYDFESKVREENARIRAAISDQKDPRILS